MLLLVILSLRLRVYGSKIMYNRLCIFFSACSKRLILSSFCFSLLLTLLSVFLFPFTVPLSSNAQAPTNTPSLTPSLTSTSISTLAVSPFPTVEPQICVTTTPYSSSIPSDCPPDLSASELNNLSDRYIRDCSHCVDYYENHFRISNSTIPDVSLPVCYPASSLPQNTATSPSSTPNITNTPSNITPTVTNTPIYTITQHPLTYRFRLFTPGPIIDWLGEYTTFPEFSGFTVTGGRVLAAGWTSLSGVYPYNYRINALTSSANPLTWSTRIFDQSNFSVSTILDKISVTVYSDGENTAGLACEANRIYSMTVNVYEDGIVTPLTFTENQYTNSTRTADSHWTFHDVTIDFSQTIVASSILDRVTVDFMWGCVASGTKTLYPFWQDIEVSYKVEKASLFIPTLTPTPTSEFALTSTPTNTPNSFSTLIPRQTAPPFWTGDDEEWADCAVPELQNGEPVVQYNPPIGVGDCILQTGGVGLCQSVFDDPIPQCYTLLPEISFSLPIVGQLDLISGLQLCIKYYSVPSLAIFGFIFSLNFIFLILGLYLVRRLMTV